MKQIYSIFLTVFFSLFLCNSVQISEAEIIRRPVSTIKDEYFEVSIVFEGKDIGEAAKESDAILLDPEVDALARLQFMVVGNNSLEVEKLKTVFS